MIARKETRFTELRIGAWLAARLCRLLPPVGAYRLSLYARRFFRSPSRSFTARTLSGAWYSYRTGDVIADTIYLCGFWDWRNVALAAYLCAPGDGIVEVGAHTGSETVSFAKIVGESGHVVAFEPEPGLADVLRANLELNGFANVDVRQVAVGDSNDPVKFLPACSKSNTGTGHAVVDAAPAQRGAIDCLSTTLDEAASNLQKVKIVFIDVEGFEVRVLRGARSFLRDRQPAIVVEASAEQLERAGTSLAELRDELLALGYCPFEITRTGLRAIAPGVQNSKACTNWLALPENSLQLWRPLNGYLRRCALTPMVLRAFNPIVRRKQSSPGRVRAISDNARGYQNAVAVVTRRHQAPTTTAE